MPEQAGDVEEQRQLETLIEQRLKQYRRGQFWWSFFYSGALFLAPLAGLVTTLDALGGARKGVTAGAAAVTTALTTIASQGRFQDKWRANRKARSSMDLLAVDVQAPGAKLDVIREKFKMIVHDEDMAILGPLPTTLVVAPEPTVAEHSVVPVADNGGGGVSGGVGPMQVR